MKKKDTKLIREIKTIVDNPDLHFWIKCKQLTSVKTYNRPGSCRAASMIRNFFKTCAGKYKDRFESAYVRPYLSAWDYNHYDHVNEMPLNQDLKSLKSMIGSFPRGIKIIKKFGSSERFSNYLKRKYPEAFEKFDEIKKVKYAYCTEMKQTSDCAWQHIFFRVKGNVYFTDGPWCGMDHWKVTKERQLKRRELDLAMEKAQTDYKKLKKASKLPPRYLYNEVSLAELQNNHKNHTYAIFNKYYYITTDTTLHYDSTKVHHGLGKLTHTDRVLRIRDRDGLRLHKVLKTYSGNFVLNAIEKHFGKVKKVKVAEMLKSVQLNQKMEIVEIGPEAKLLPKLRSFKRQRMYQRLFAGTSYDYCVLRDGITYHGSSIEQCIAGWEKKKELSTAGAKIINMKILRTLGFCSDGIRSFCSSNGIDSHDDYTVRELKIIVSKNLSYNRSYYGRELEQIGVL